MSCSWAPACLATSCSTRPVPLSFQGEGSCSSSSDKFLGRNRQPWQIVRRRGTLHRRRAGTPARVAAQPKRTPRRSALLPVTILSVSLHDRHATRRDIIPIIPIILATANAKRERAQLGRSVDLVAPLLAIKLQTSSCRRRPPPRSAPNVAHPTHAISLYTVPCLQRLETPKLELLDAKRLNSQPALPHQGVLSKRATRVSQPATHPAGQPLPWGSVEERATNTYQKVHPSDRPKLDFERKHRGAR